MSKFQSDKNVFEQCVHGCSLTNLSTHMSWTERLFLVSECPTNQESEPLHPGRENDRLVNKFELRSAG